MSKNMQNGQFEALWTTEEICEYLKLKPSYVRDLRHQKRIPFKKIGRLVRYSPSEIQAWIESGEAGKYSSLSDIN